MTTEKWFFEASEAQAMFLNNYRNQRWDEAITALKKLEGLPEIDLSTLTGLYRDRISVYREQDLGPNWDGVYSATSK